MPLLVEIRITDLPESGGAMAPSGTTGLASGTTINTGTVDLAGVEELLTGRVDLVAPLGVLFNTEPPTGPPFGLRRGLGSLMGVP